MPEVCAWAAHFRRKKIAKVWTVWDTPPPHREGATFTVALTLEIVPLWMSLPALGFV